MDGRESDRRRKAQWERDGVEWVSEPVALIEALQQAVGGRRPVFVPGEPTRQKLDEIDRIAAAGRTFVDNFRKIRLSRMRNSDGVDKVLYTQANIAAVMAIVYGHSSWRQTTLGKIENGERDLKLDEALALCAILDVDLADLITEDGAARVAAKAAGGLFTVIDSPLN